MARRRSIERKQKANNARVLQIASDVLSIRDNKRREKRIRQNIRANAPRVRNPIVFLDVSVGDEPAERLVFELFADSAPMLAENFRALCTGEMGIGRKTKRPLCYKGSAFHHVIKEFQIEGGDFSIGNGTGGESIYGGTFKEKNRVRRIERGSVSTSDRGVPFHSNSSTKRTGSRFSIMLAPLVSFDRKCTVFRQLISGQEQLQKMENVSVHGWFSPDFPITIVDCRELVDQKENAARLKKGNARKVWIVAAPEKEWSAKSDAPKDKPAGQQKENLKRFTKRNERRYPSSDSSCDSESNSNDSALSDYSDNSCDSESNSNDSGLSDYSDSSFDSESDSDYSGLSYYNMTRDTDHAGDQMECMLECIRPI